MKNFKYLLISLTILSVFLLSSCSVFDYFKFSSAMSLYDEGNYSEARSAFAEIEDYSTSSDMIKQIDYHFACEKLAQAEAAKEASLYNEAAALFEALAEYSDSADKGAMCRNEAIYIAAAKLCDEEKYMEATELYNQIYTYKDSKELSEYCVDCYTYKDGMILFESGDYPSAYVIFDLLGDFKDSVQMAQKAYDISMENEYTKALLLYDEGKYEAAAMILSDLGDYKNSREYFISALTKKANASFSKKDFDVSSIFYGILLDNGVDLGRAAIKSADDAYTYGCACFDGGNLEEALAVFTVLGKDELSSRDERDLIGLTNVRMNGADIFTLSEMGLITYELRGKAVNLMSFTVSNTSQYDFTLYIDSCTWLTPDVKGVQNMLLYEDTSILLPAGSTHQLSLKTACLNIELIVPDDTVTFTPQRAITLPRGKTLRALVDTAVKSQASFPTLQAAVWVVTDNAGYDAMGYLQRENGERVITREIYNNALTLLFGE